MNLDFRGNKLVAGTDNVLVQYQLVNIQFSKLFKTLSLHFHIFMILLMDSMKFQGKHFFLNLNLFILIGS